MALIITIIILIILAAVSISAIVGTNMINTAVAGTDNYVEAGEVENKIMQNTVDYMDSVAASLTEQTGGSSGSNGEKATEVITASNYGDTIEYSANGVTDWKIFYNDGSNVYIIASDYLDSSKVPSATGMTTQGNYLAWWDSFTVTSFTNSQSGFLFNGLSSVTPTNPNYYATASLLDTSIWSSFVDSSCAEYAIGSPTVEMWVASWNEKGYTPLYTAVDSTGYYIGTSSSPSSTVVNLSGETGYNDTLYYPYKSEVDNQDADNYVCYGYWLASPSAFAYPFILSVYADSNAYICYHTYNNHYDGVRPVVCLSSGIALTFDTDAWVIGI